MRTVYSGLVDESFIGQTVTLFGWAHRRRDHGGVIFIDLRDREGIVQVVCDPDRPEVFATADKCRNEFCLRVVGVVRARPEGTKNETLVSGGIEVLCHELEILNPSVTPPFHLDDENLSETTRLTYRVLDLRRGVMQKNLRTRYRAAMAFRKFLDKNGFIDIETPMLTRSTPEGARDYLVPSRVQDGCSFALPQSPQLFKQLLMVAGFDRYYQIVKCFRDEAQAILDLIPQLDEHFDAAVDLMLRCTGKVIITGVGKSGHIGAKMAATLASTGTPAFFINPLDVFHGDLGVMTPDDVVIAISNSGQSEELLRFIPYLLEHHIPLIGISGNPDSLLA